LDIVVGEMRKAQEIEFWARGKNSGGKAILLQKQEENRLLGSLSTREEGLRTPLVRENRKDARSGQEGEKKKALLNKKSALFTTVSDRN